MGDFNKLLCFFSKHTFFILIIKHKRIFTKHFQKIIYSIFFHERLLVDHVAGFGHQMWIPFSIVRISWWNLSPSSSLKKRPYLEKIGLNKVYFHAHKYNVAKEYMCIFITKTNEFQNLDSASLIFSFHSCLICDPSQIRALIRKN